MPTSVGPNTFGEENLVFGYDTGDTVNSYKGEPTTNNYGGSFRNLTGTSYSFFGEWTSDPTRLTKTYSSNLATPIGPGATLIEESGTAGFHHLGRYGGAEESGAHSISCYIYPLVSGITDFTIGMLADNSSTVQFNLDTRAITYGGGISNRNAFIRDVPGWPGWLRVGANIEGRSGGWVGAFGYSVHSSYTGTVGGKKAYITGVQYEYKASPTPFTAGTRSATQGLTDLTGNSTIDLTNVSFDSNAQMTFDGTDDKAVVANFPHIWDGSVSLETVVSWNDNTRSIIFGNYNVGANDINFEKLTTGNLRFYWNRGERDITTGNNVVTTSGAYHHVVFIRDKGSNSFKFYVDGEVVGTTSNVGTDVTSTGSTFRIGGDSRNGDTIHNGDIPLLKIYNRALTASEIKANYNAIKGRFNI